MKKFILIFMISCIITSMYAQDEVKKFPYKNSITLSPFGFANKTLSLNYERGFGSNVGIMLSGGIYYYEKEYTNMGYMGEMQFRYYFQSNSYKESVWNRFFFAPYAFDRQYEVSGYEYEIQELIYPYNYVTTIKDFSINSFGGGAIFGYKLSIRKFSLEVFLGGGIKLCTTEVDNDQIYTFNNRMIDPAYKGIVPKVGFNIGFFF